MDEGCRKFPYAQQRVDKLNWGLTDKKSNVIAPKGPLRGEPSSGEVRLLDSAHRADSESGTISHLQSILRRLIRRGVYPAEGGAPRSDEIFLFGQPHILLAIDFPLYLL